MVPKPANIVAEAIKNLGFQSLNQMQADMSEACRRAKKILLLSPTGTGKTVAFLLPLLEKISAPQKNIRAMILTPSRELALQIGQVFKSMGSGLKATVCYGGHQVRTELNNLKEPPALLIGTPGRINYHLQKGNVRADETTLLVIDEYDKSLEFGFEGEISAILKQLPDPELLILTSATRADILPEFVHADDPFVLDFRTESMPAGLQINIVRAEGKDKLGMLIKLLSGMDEGLTLVFCNHREAVERISSLLNEGGILHETYHGGYEQSRRERALIKFRNGSAPILVTTDLASRGLDITGISHIIHYQQASNETAFMHRNGRTARMEGVGTAWILLSSDENIPFYAAEQGAEILLSDNITRPSLPYFATLYFGAGKKDKISKTDIVGLLIQKGGLRKEEIGTIDILDYESFAAVPANKTGKLVSLLRNEKIKNKKVKIARSN